MKKVLKHLQDNYLLVKNVFFLVVVPQYGLNCLTYPHLPYFNIHLASDTSPSSHPLMLVGYSSIVPSSTA